MDDLRVKVGNVVSFEESLWVITWISENGVWVTLKDLLTGVIKKDVVSSRIARNW